MEQRGDGVIGLVDCNPTSSITLLLMNFIDESDWDEVWESLEHYSLNIGD